MTNHTQIKSYVRKHTLWQALGGATINMHRGLDKSITVNLIVNGYVAASESPKFRTFKARDEAYYRACQTGHLEFIAGSTANA